MAAMMEILKQIQRDLADQKNYLRNLHVIHRTINEKFDVMDKKLDLQHSTLESLERQVRRSNTMLFGSHETDPNHENSNIVFNKPDFNNKEEAGHLLEQSEKYMESPENKFQNAFKDAEINDPENNSEDDTDNENNERIDSDKNKISEFTAAEVKDINALIRNYVDTKEAFVEEAVNQAIQIRKLETVQMSPAYFTVDQMEKLNRELKKIAEQYQSTDIFPVIEVTTPLINSHPVMVELSKGIYFEDHNKEKLGIYLGSKGFKRSEILELIAENPNISLMEVIKEGLKARNEWYSQRCNFEFHSPYIGDGVRLR